MVNARTEDAVLADLAQGMTARSVRELLALRACTCPDRPAYSTPDGRALTYGALAARAREWRAALAGAGSPAGARLGLRTDDPLDFAGAYLSLLAAGRTVVPLDPDAPSAEIDRLAGELDLALVVEAGRPWSPARRLASDDRHGVEGPPAGGVLLCSSGSTGTPKVVPLAEWQLVHRAQLVAAHHRLGAGDRGYSPLPLFHVNAQVVGVLATLVAGATLLVERRFHRTGFWDRVAAAGVTWINTVPAILAILAEDPPPDLWTAARVRFARSASAPLPAAVLRAFEERCGIRVLETYGMTEAASQITANPLDPGLRRPGSVGLPVGVELRVVDPAGLPVPAGVEGVVEIRGPAVATSYLAPGGSGATVSARGPDGWLVTGDVGRLDPDGYLFLTGRADDVINCGGEKVYPREIEDLLRTEPRVTEAVVVGQPHPVLGRCPVAVVTAAPGADRAQLAAHLRALCAARLSRAKRPQRLVVAASLPTGPTGKVSRRLVERELAS
jgi:acyl-CoA synthetase (AMP-forming)/AMP-acid ligase II